MFSTFQRRLLRTCWISGAFPHFLLPQNPGTPPPENAPKGGLRNVTSPATWHLPLRRWLRDLGGKVMAHFSLPFCCHFRFEKTRWGGGGRKTRGGSKKQGGEVNKKQWSLFVYRSVISTSWRMNPQSVWFWKQQLISILNDCGQLYPRWLRSMLVGWEASLKLQ